MRRSRVWRRRSAGSTSSRASNPPCPPTAAAAPAPATVTAGIVSRNAYFWPVWVAEAQGLFTQQGITNEVVLTRSPASGHQMLANGGADVALSTPETAIIAAAKGAP